MKYFWLLTLLLYNYSYSQDKTSPKKSQKILRDIRIKGNSVYDNRDSAARISEYESYLQIWVEQDTSGIFRRSEVLLIHEKSEGYYDGLFMGFYAKNSLPLVKGTYIKIINNSTGFTESVKDVEWFHWKETGELYKKEIWDRGKLIKSYNYKQKHIKR